MKKTNNLTSKEALLTLYNDLSPHLTIEVQTIWKIMSCGQCKLGLAMLVVFVGALLFEFIDNFEFDFSKQMLVEMIILLVIFVIFFVLQYRERALTAFDLYGRAKYILDEVNRYNSESLKINYQYDPATDIKVPITPALSLVRVVRDDSVKIIPTNLLVKGDLVLLGYGDVAPAKVLSQDHNLTLDRNQFFKPVIKVQDRVPFTCLETPFISTFKDIMSIKRKKSILQCQRDRVIHLFSTVSFPVIIAAIVAVNVIFVVKYSGSPTLHILLYSIYAALPFLPFYTILFLYLVKVYGNARIQVLFETLKKEKTPYDQYNIDEDEFDVEAGNNL
jgi:hypothetical protein